MCPGLRCFPDTNDAGVSKAGSCDPMVRTHKRPGDISSRGYVRLHIPCKRAGEPNRFSLPDNLSLLYRVVFGLSGKKVDRKQHLHIYYIGKAVLIHFFSIFLKIFFAPSHQGYFVV
jgi:hypothetical protein